MKLGATLLTVLAMTSTAKAATFTQVIQLAGGVPFGSSSHVMFDPYLGQFEELAVPAFDTSLGTLTDLDVKLVDSFLQTQPVESSTATVPLSADFYAHFDLTIFAKAFKPLQYSTLVSAKITPDRIDPRYGTAQISSNFSYEVAMPYTAYDDPTGFIVDDYASFAPNSGVAFYLDDASVQAGGSLTLTYTYTPVPEPGSLSLALFGLAALAGLSMAAGRRAPSIAP